MLYYVLWQSKLIPRWISGWGLFAILLHPATTFLIMFHLQTAFSTINMVMNLPIGLQEMVMAVWLIVKGFNPSALASLSAKTATNQLLSAAWICHAGEREGGKPSLKPSPLGQMYMLVE